MLSIAYTTQFKKDLKRAKRRGDDLNRLKVVMEKIRKQVTLPKALRDHSLTGGWVGYRELHLRPDWLLIYKIDELTDTVYFVRTGSHSDLFR